MGQVHETFPAEDYMLPEAFSYIPTASGEQQILRKCLWNSLIWQFRGREIQNLWAAASQQTYLQSPERFFNELSQTNKRYKT